MFALADRRLSGMRAQHPRSAKIVLWSGVITRTHCGRITPIKRSQQRRGAMAFTRVRVALGIVLLVSCVLDAARARPQGNEADSAAVKKVFDDFNNAFNSHDAHAV